jgi:hypothetical protein
MPIYIQKVALGYRLVDGMGKAWCPVDLIPDPQLTFDYTLILSGMGCAICWNCHQIISSSQVFGYTGTVLNKASYIYGCRVCNSWAGLIDGQYFSTGDVLGTLISQRLERPAKVVEPKIHIDKDFYGFEMSNFRELWPLGLYSLHEILYSFGGPHRHLIPYTFAKAGWNPLRPQPTQSWGFATSGEAKWVLLSRASCSWPNRLGPPNDAHGIALSKDFLTTHKLSFLNAVALCKALCAPDLVDSGVPLLSEATRLGLLPPVLSAELKAELDQCVSRFGDPKRILQRKYFKRAGKRRKATS